MKFKSIYIRDISHVSAFGDTKNQFKKGLFEGIPSFEQRKGVFGSYVSPDVETKLEELSKTPALRGYDRSTLLAILASSKIDKNCLMPDCAVQMASSRGATGLLESALEQFGNTGAVPVKTSPNSTLGNLSSNLAQHLKLSGFQTDLSVTCSGFNMALLNSISWISADLANQVIAGSSESALTPFTQAQIRALKLNSPYQDEFPCKALDLSKKHNSLILGEAAGLAVIQNNSENSLAQIVGMGWSMEKLKSPSGLDNQGIGLQKSMSKALDMAGISNVDLILCHAPGTLLGDKAELNAIGKVFQNIPETLSLKPLIGHSFSSSSLSNLFAAICLMEEQRIPKQIYLDKKEKKISIKTILINSIGFGGQAVSVIISSNS